MGLSTVLKATTRKVKSSNYATRLRTSGYLPAVFYGPSQDDVAQSICLDYKEFRNALTDSEGNHSLFTLVIEGQEPQATLLKDFQMDPVSRKAIHADFYKINLEKPITLKIPLVLTGKPAGVEKGGQLQSGIREVQITVLPANAPAELEVDVSSLNLGQSLHISQIVLPEGLQIRYVADLPVATVVIPKGMKAELEAADDEDGAKKPTK